MTEKKGSSDDEILYRLLSEKLHRHYCGDEGSQMTDEEVEAVLNVMETIKFPDDSYFNADAAWVRFQRKYMSGEATEVSAEFIPGGGIYDLAGVIRTMETEVNLRAGSRKRRKRVGVLIRMQSIIRSRVVRWTAIAVSAAGIMFAGLNVGTYATARMGFFEFISKDGNSLEFFITGERDEERESFEFEQSVLENYESWDKVKEKVGENILVPEYIPERFYLSSLVISDGESQGVVAAKYDGEEENYFQIRIEHYVKDKWYYKVLNAEEDYAEKILPSGKTIYYSQQDDDITASFFDQEFFYSVDGKMTLDEIIMIIENMK